ncbi:MAG: endolytic transglycosylase MltG [Candidatus Levyibacteriota bacterium]
MKKLLIVVGIFLIFFLGVFAWWHTDSQPVSPKSNEQKIFVVNNGEGVRDIAFRLKQQGLIKDPIIFFLVVKQLGLDGKIEAGDFRLSPGMNTVAVAENLTHGTLDIWVTIPEGKRAEEVATIFEQKLPSFDATWKGKLEQAEGFLFPDTYLVPRTASADFVVTMMKNNFDKKYQSIATNVKGFSQLQTVTVASIIEREAVFPEDRPLVASVIYNRLNLGMALQVDPSVSYALGYQPGTKTWWKQDLTFDDLQVNSPYNTYKNPGLPPGPICNPGLSSLEAAAHPASTNYLYYYSDKTGKLHFARTLEEHNANIKKYGP